MRTSKNMRGGLSCPLQSTILLRSAVRHAVEIPLPAFDVFWLSSKASRSLRFIHEPTPSPPFSAISGGSIPHSTFAIETIQSMTPNAIKSVKIYILKSHNNCRYKSWKQLLWQQSLLNLGFRHLKQKWN